MAYELPVDLIRQVKTVTRADAGLSDYDPTGDIPPLPSLSEAVAALDPSPPYLRCKICKGKLLRGVQSVICIYCGRPNDVLPDPISFKDTLACRWLLESLHLDGSEVVGQATKNSKFNREQGTPKGQVPLSDFLNLKITWPSAEEKKEIILNKQTQERNFLNLTGADLDNFFSASPIASDIPEEHSIQHKQVEATEYKEPSAHNNLSFFENMQPPNQSSERKEGVVLAEAKEVKSHDDSSFFQNVKPVELAPHSSKDEDDDAFSGWEPSFQSADSGNQLDISKTFDPFISSGVQHETPKSSDPFDGSKVDLSSMLDSVFAPGTDSKDGKTQVSSAVSTSMDDWDDDLWNNLSSNLSQQTGQTDLIVGVNNVVSEDAKDSDRFDVGDWQSNNVDARDNTEMVGQATKNSEFNREQGTPKGQVPLSDTLNLKITWLSEEEKKEIILNRQTQERNFLNLTGADLDNVFSASPILVASDIPVEHSFQHKHVEATEYKEPSTQNNLSFFKNMQSSDQSLERKEGAVVADSKEVGSCDDPNFFLNVKAVELAAHSLKDKDDDAFSGWESSFQSADSGNQLDSPKTFDPVISSGVQHETPKSSDFFGGSKLDLSSILDSVFAPGTNSKDGKTKVGTAAPTSMDDWNDDLWNDLSSKFSQQTGQTDLSIGVKNVVSEDAKDSDWFDVGQWQSNNINAPDNTIWRNDDDSFVDWNDFTSSTIVNVSSENSATQSHNQPIFAAGEKSGLNLHSFNNKFGEENAVDDSFVDWNDFTSSTTVNVSSKNSATQSHNQPIVAAGEKSGINLLNTDNKFEEVDVDDNSFVDWNDFTSSTSINVSSENSTTQSHNQPIVGAGEKSDVNLLSADKKFEEVDVNDDSSVDWNDFTCSTSVNVTSENSATQSHNQPIVAAGEQSDLNLHSADNKFEEVDVDDNSFIDWNDFTSSTGINVSSENSATQSHNQPIVAAGEKSDLNLLSAGNNFKEVDVNDDSSVDWNDFTCSTSIYVSSENSPTQSHNQPLVAAGEKSNVNLLGTDNKFEKVDVDDVSFIDWNDFTSSTSVNVSSKNSATQSQNQPIVAAGEKSDVKLLSTNNKFEDIDAGSFSQEDPSPSLFRKENVSAALTVSGLDVSSSERVVDADSYTGGGGPELPTRDEDIKTAGSKEVERTVSRTRDISFMLEENLFSFKTL